MSDNKNKEKLDSKIVEGDIKSIDPTKLGGLDGSSSMPDLDDEALNWTKSRGKKK